MAEAGGLEEPAGLRGTARCPGFGKLLYGLFALTRCLWSLCDKAYGRGGWCAKQRLIVSPRPPPPRLQVELLLVCVPGEAVDRRDPSTETQSKGHPEP